MCVLYRAVLLALLALGSNAALAPEECEKLTTTLQPSDLDKIFGNWVLVGGVADFPSGSQMVGNVSSSHVELQLSPDNKTVIYNERNMYLDKSCTTYYSNNTVVDSTSSSLRLIIDFFFKEKDGAVSVYDDFGRVELYQTDPDCLLMVYSGTYEGTPGRYLLSYRREGKHQDAEELKVALGTHQKHAECLKFAGDGHFNYDGVEELCPKKSMGELKLEVLGSNAALAPEECEKLTTTLQPSDLDKIFGNWVLVGGVADFPFGSQMVGNVSSSHVELQLSQDNKTVIYNERNMHLDKSCTTYYSNNTVVDSTSSSLRLIIDFFFKEKDGAVSVYDDSGRVELYQTDPDCLLMVYSGTYEGTPGRYLLSYRREGKHQDAEELKVALGTHQKHAECLKFAGDGHFNYDGVEELCPKKSLEEVKHEVRSII